MAVCAEKVDLTMAKIEQVSVANNVKAMHKSTLTVMRELFIQAVNFRQDEHDKEVRDLKETFCHLNRSKVA